jgi:hypothetical protein
MLDPSPKIKLCTKDTQKKRKEKKRSHLTGKKRGKIKRYKLFKFKTRMKGNQLQIVYIDPHIY